MKRVPNIILLILCALLPLQAKENTEILVFDSYSIERDVPILRFISTNTKTTAEYKIGDKLNGYEIVLFRRITYFGVYRGSPEEYPDDRSEVVLVNKTDKSTITAIRKQAFGMKLSNQPIR